VASCPAHLTPLAHRHLVPVCINVNKLFLYHILTLLKGDCNILSAGGKMQWEVWKLKGYFQTPSAIFKDYLSKSFSSLYYLFYYEFNTQTLNNKPLAADYFFITGNRAYLYIQQLPAEP
jgi:hypothetical protein